MPAATTTRWVCATAQASRSEPRGAWRVSIAVAGPAGSGVAHLPGRREAGEPGVVDRDSAWARRPWPAWARWCSPGGGGSRSPRWAAPPGDAGVAARLARAIEPGATGPRSLTAPDRVQLWFNEAIEPKFSSVSVWDAAGQQVDLGRRPRWSPRTRKRLTVGLKPLARGVSRLLPRPLGRRARRRERVSLRARP